MTRFPRYGLVHARSSGFDSYAGVSAVALSELGSNYTYSILEYTFAFVSFRKGAVTYFQIKYRFLSELG
jgi:hypothetical protein